MLFTRTAARRVKISPCSTLARNGSVSCTPRRSLTKAIKEGAIDATTAEPTKIVYDKISLQPLTYSVASVVTVSLFVAYAATQVEAPKNATPFINIMLSPYWSYLGIAIGAFNLYGASRFPKFLVSEVAVAGRKVYIRTHTMHSKKSDVQEVFEVTDLMRIKNTSPDSLNWKSISTNRRFTMQRTEELEKLVPYGFDTAPTRMSATSVSNVGGKTLEETEKFEKSLREKWTKKKST
jgi:hypothetical protein